MKYFLVVHLEVSPTAHSHLTLRLVVGCVYLSVLVSSHFNFIMYSRIAAVVRGQGETPPK